MIHVPRAIIYGYVHTYTLIWTLYDLMWFIYHCFNYICSQNDHISCIYHRIWSIRQCTWTIFFCTAQYKDCARATLTPTYSDRGINAKVITNKVTNKVVGLLSTVNKWKKGDYLLNVFGSLSTVYVDHIIVFYIWVCSAIWFLCHIESEKVGAWT